MKPTGQEDISQDLKRVVPRILDDVHLVKQRKALRAP